MVLQVKHRPSALMADGSVKEMMNIDFKEKDYHGIIQHVWQVRSKIVAIS